MFGNSALVLRNTHRCLHNLRWFCASKTPYDHKAHYKAKPEDIPKGIWQEENDTANYTTVEEVKDRWHYVERLLPHYRIPEPPKKISTVGWKAPEENIPDTPYYVLRTRNHMLPVYEKRVYDDQLLVTRVAKIQGDIWLFEYDLKKYLEEKIGESLQSHVNEIMCRVDFKGNHVEIVKEWLYNKGF